MLDATALVAPLDADNLSIGSWLTGDSFFKGSIDDLRIYNRALSPADVSALYHSAPPAPGDLGLYFKFDEASGTAAADVSGNNNTGALLGGAAFAAGRVNNALGRNGTRLNSS